MLKEGLYLEEKDSVIGTGSTSRNIVLRSMWVTREVTDESAVLQLLNDKGQPTAYVETLTVAEMDQRMIHRPIKPEVWEALKKKCEAAKPMNRAQAPAKAAAPPKAATPQKAAAKPSLKPKTAPKKKGNWWDT